MVSRILMLLQCPCEGGRSSSPSLVVLHSARHDFEKKTQNVGLQVGSTLWSRRQGC